MLAVATVALIGLLYLKINVRQDFNFEFFAYVIFNIIIDILAGVDIIDLNIDVGKHAAVKIEFYFSCFDIPAYRKDQITTLYFYVVFTHFQYTCHADFIDIYLLCIIIISVAPVSINGKKHKKERKSVMIVIPNGISYDKIIRTGRIYICSVTYTNVRHSWKHKERFLDTNEFIFVLDGTVHLRVNNKVFNIGKNEFLIMPAFSTIAGERPSESACSFYTVAYEGGVDILNRRERKKQSVAGNIVLIYEILRKMRTVYRPEIPDNPELDALFLTLAYELKAKEDSEIDTGLPMQKMLDYIHDHVNQALSIDDLCKEFNYSSDYISKLFKKYYGITVKQYINQVKMSTAKHLLTTSHLTVEQVGNAIGYDSVRLFYKFFKYHEKVTPSEYRKTHK